MTSPNSAPTGGGFFLDVEKAEAAVDALRRVHGELLELRREAFNLARPAEAGRDAVSGGLEHVQGLIDGMEADIARQRELDDSAARASTRP